MRDKLVAWEFSFDHSELVRDLVGDLINLNIFSSAPPFPRQLPAGGTTVTQEGDGEDSTTDTGLILWAEPHLAGSWEATPHFLQKWAWAIADCQELIEATNCWRTLRGETPLRFSHVPCPVDSS